MRKAAGKRLPHGATTALVFDALWRLHRQGGTARPVSRAALLEVLALAETTVDDRLRVLVKRGAIRGVGRGLYLPASPKAFPEPQPLGTERHSGLLDGGVYVERWMSWQELAREQQMRLYLSQLGRRRE